MVKSLNRLIIAVVIYFCFGVYLYLPYFENFKRIQYLFIVNAVLASAGCFVLSRRWVANFAGSFFAGAIYGFGPYMLGLAKYHPTAGFLAALIPWLFCPAAFGPKGKAKWQRVPLSILPFLAIILFFTIGGYFRLFAVPTQIKMRPADLACLLAPAVLAEKVDVLVGFYHVPVASLIIGVSMLIASRRYNVMVIFALGTVLAFCGPIIGISPVIWLTLPLLCCSVLIGEGFSGLLSASYSDRKWVLGSVIAMLALSIVTLLLATRYADVFAGLGLKYTRGFAEAAKMYILGAIAAAVVFFMARGKTRLYWLRIFILCAAIAVDISYSAGYIVDKLL